jgi:hypothetical protein
VFFVGLGRGEIPYVTQPMGFSATTLPPQEAGWLGLAFAFGFLLCPYLDLTFHAARQATTAGEGRAAFTFGFCILFPLVLLFTAAYSGPLVLFLSQRIYPQLMLLVATHLIAHSGFTVAAHARQLAARISGISVRGFLIFVLSVIVAVLLGIVPIRQDYHGLRGHEVIYRVFMGFYGLVFPAYVWLRVVRPMRSGLRVAFAVLAALPLFWLGFVELKMVWFLPGVLILVLAKWGFTRRRPGGAGPLPPQSARAEGAGM